jgi:ribose transport system permease protein
MALSSRPARRFGPGQLGSRFSVLGVWVLLIAFYAVTVPHFLSAGVFETIFGSQQALVFLTASLLCTITVGEFVDMSVASNFGFAAVLLGVLNVDLGWNVWLATAAAIVCAAAVGAVNGWLTVFLGVTPISGLPVWFQGIETHAVLGLPLGFYEGLVLMLGFAYVMWFTPLGRNMRFVGANREVSRLAGIRVSRLRFGSYVSAGLIAGVGGVLAAASVGGFDITTSQTYLLPIFAATFLGTAIIEPGKFQPIGTLLAVYFLATGILGLQLLLTGASWASDVFYGGVLIIAVTVSTLLHRRA